MRKSTGRRKSPTGKRPGKVQQAKLPIQPPANIKIPLDIDDDINEAFDPDNAMHTGQRACDALKQIEILREERLLQQILDDTYE